MTEKSGACPDCGINLYLVSEPCCEPACQQWCRIEINQTNEIEALSMRPQIDDYMIWLRRENARLRAAPSRTGSTEIDSLALVIESAVRNADPSHHEEVMAALNTNRLRCLGVPNATIMKGRVTESIYSGKSTVVPLADVQHIEKRELGLVVVTKHTRWDNDGDFWANSIWIDKAEADAFMQAWCRYRSELEADTKVRP
jgi:hypothetical protein